jgi:hypothetical protein
MIEIVKNHKMVVKNAFALLTLQVSFKKETQLFNNIIKFFVAVNM